MGWIYGSVAAKKKKKKKRRWKWKITWINKRHVPFWVNTIGVVFTARVPGEGGITAEETNHHYCHASLCGKGDNHSGAGRRVGIECLRWRNETCSQVGRMKLCGTLCPPHWLWGRGGNDTTALAEVLQVHSQQGCAGLIQLCASPINKRNSEVDSLTDTVTARDGCTRN